MITMFTIPKAFKGNMKVIQDNAIKSWQMLDPKPEIILYGNDPGVKEAAKRLKVKHVPNVKCNRHGTPYLDRIFRDADKRAKNKLMCFMNADIIFLTNINDCIKQVPYKKYLFIGRRFDVKIEKLINFKDKKWKEKIYNHLIKKGTFHTMGTDYFVYNKGLFAKMPNFVIGRGCNDSWKILSALEQRVPVIDASDVIVAVHQNHDYSHLKNAPHQKYYKTEEGKRNIRLARFDKVRPPSFYDSTHLFTKKGIKRAMRPMYIAQRAYALTTRHKILFPAYLAFKAVRKLSPIVHKFKKPKKELT